MAAGYVDDHRVILYRDGAAARDITAFCGDLTAKDDLDALSVEVTFHIFKSVWDKYTPALNLAPGDKIRIVNHGNTVFSGVVVTVTLDGTVTAYDRGWYLYDRGWYLNKSEIILQVNNLAADQVIRQASAKAGVSVASVCSLPTKITQLWTGKTPADIFDEVLETAEAETGKNYYYYVAERGLVVAPLPTSAIKAMHRPAENLPGFDITWALGEVSGEDSISDTYNAVVIAAESDGRAYRGAQASNAASIARYGFLQKVETVTENPGTAALGQRVRNLLAGADRVGRKRQISEIWGCDEVRSGVVLDFNSPAFGISGRHRVTSVTHQYGGAGHVMSLEISALDEPRAAAAGKSSAEAVRAASADSVKVWGLPDLGGGASGGTTVKALFTAYYPAANALEGGFLDAQGNRLDPSKKTCAAPPSVAFGTKVTVQGTGTSLDGETYTVNDRGGAIQIENGVYHFDLLMRTNVECNSWGRKTGTAILGGTSGGGAASSFVSTALGEVGYREGSGNRTKYGAEMGCDGVAWCVIFVCWCAKHASAPIPTTYTAVSEMRSYFEKRGKFKSVASGYKPKAGDLMIIGSSHIGIVLSGGASSCETVEGNYSGGVGRVTRSYSEITGFCCPW